MKRFIFILLIGYFLISCHDSEKYSYQLSQLEDWSVPLDTLTSNISFQVRSIQLNGKLYVAMYSRNLHAINLWNIDSKKKEFTIPLKKDGQDGIYRLTSYYIKAMDSVFVIPTYHKQIYLIDFNGHVKNKFVLDKKEVAEQKENEIDKMDFLGDMYTPVQIIGNHMLIGTISSEFGGLDPKFSKFPIGVTYNLKTSALNSKFMFFPETYLNKNFGYHNNVYYSDVDISRKNILISFPVDDKIYLRDINGKLLKQIEANSDYLDIHFSALKGKGQSVTEKYFLDNPSFDRILSDPFRKVYYRFALQKYEGQQNVPTAMFSSFKPLSDIILNEQFEKIGETLLPANKHFIFNAFVCKKGLYISNAHPNNPENDENKLSFTCYQLVKK